MVLIVEDDMVFIKAIKTKLERNKIKVIYKNRIEEAFQILEADGNISHVIVDLIMPIQKYIDEYSQDKYTNTGLYFLEECFTRELLFNKYIIILTCRYDSAAYKYYEYLKDTWRNQYFEFHYLRKDHASNEDILKFMKQTKA